MKIDASRYPFLHQTISTYLSSIYFALQGSWCFRRCSRWTVIRNKNHFAAVAAAGSWCRRTHAGSPRMQATCRQCCLPAVCTYRPGSGWPPRCCPLDLYPRSLLLFCFGILHEELSFSYPHINLHIIITMLFYKREINVFPAQCKLCKKKIENWCLMILSETSCTCDNV